MRTAALAAIVATLTACTSTRYVPVETIRDHYRDRVVNTTDTLRVTDSVIIDRAADTIRIERWRTQYRDRMVSIRDTIALRDTIAVPYAVPTPLTPWQQTKQSYGGLAMAILSGVAIWQLLKALKKLTFIIK